IEAARAAEANAKFQVFFEQGAQFAAVLTLQGNVIEANRLCLDACGFTRRHILGKPFWECGWWSPSPDLVALARQAFDRAAEGEIVRDETRFFMHNGAERMIDLVLAPVIDDFGQTLFVAVTG